MRRRTIWALRAMVHRCSQGPRRQQRAWRANNCPASNDSSSNPVPTPPPMLGFVHKRRGRITLRPYTNAALTSKAPGGDRRATKCW